MCSCVSQPISLGTVLCMALPPPGTASQQTHRVRVLLRGPGTHSRLLASQLLKPHPAGQASLCFSHQDAGKMSDGEAKDLSKGPGVSSHGSRR